MPRFCLAGLVLLAATNLACAQDKAKRPNVIIILTDDQGHGDLGFHGNPVIKTPNLDRLAKQSVRMKNFYVSPVCSPTRASLLTGRYNYRTGVVDTFVGRSLMHPDEITLAEILRGLGYRTGIFGKWHLGDNYPLRAIDQGFMEALVLKGGGIGQPSDPPGGESYFNPILQHSASGGREPPVAVKKDGYCSDIFGDAAIDFIAKNKDKPFFCYLAFNCPHTPLEVPKKYHDLYKDRSSSTSSRKLASPSKAR
jgi:arylsulfatase A-like enzyme